MILCVSVPCCCLATQSCPSLCDLHGLYSTPGFTVHGISQQEYWSGLPFPSTGYLSSSGIDSRLLHWQVDSLPLYHWGNHVPSVQFSCSVMSDSLQPHESQHARPPCPLPSPRVTQTHVHRVRDAIQPSHPWSSPSPPIPNPSEHRSLFQWVNSSHEVAKVLELQI